MFSPSLVTYTFYSNMDVLEKRKSNIIEYGNDLKFTKANVVNLSRNISAFNFVFGGDSTLVPISNEEELRLAEGALLRRLIDAYVAGLVSDRNKPERFYHGNVLSLALIFAYNLGVNIEKHELDEILISISDLSNDTNVVYMKGFEKYDFDLMVSKCRDLGFDFSFLNKLEKKYNRYVRRRNRWWPFF